MIFSGKKTLTFAIIPLVFVLLSAPATGQFYETGQDPFSVSWKKIKTKNYKLIFPSDFENNARVFASVLDTFYPVSSRYLLKNPRRVSIVFHTQSSLSNGMVVYAPKRMELYTIPPQDNYPQDWLDQLALHETRHVVQLDALNRGLTRLGYFITGQQAVGAASGLVPRWFLEGDAVYSETYFSNAGRGRSAAFLMPYRALILEKNRYYPYEKAMLGSYRDFVPDIYQMGYPMVKMMSDSFDSDIFGKALRYTGRNPYLVFPFGHSLKKTSGLNNRRTYEYTYSRWAQIWAAGQNYQTYSQWPVNKKRYFVNYNMPVYTGDSTVIAQRWSLAETRRYIMIDKYGREKVLFAPGSNSAEKISVHKNSVVWSENRSDLRWHQRTYSEIVTYDLEKGRKKRLTRKTWYFSPAYSPDGKQIAAVEETPQYESFLIILDASGTVVSRTGAPAGEHLQHPQWSTNGDIYCLSVGHSGKSLVRLTTAGLWEKVVPASFKNISQFILVNNQPLIAGENDGVNNLFLFNPSDSSFSQVTRSRFGAFEPSYNEESSTLFFTEYTSNGYRIASLPWNPGNYPTTGYQTSEPDFNGRANNEFNVQQMGRDTSRYEVKKYSRLLNSLNIHSWAPAYFNYSVSNFSNPAIYPGAMILSQDVLGTMISSFGISFQEGFMHYHANISYKALYPVISWSMDAGGEAPRAGGSKTIPLEYTTNLRSTVNISLPLNISLGRYVSGITPYVEWRHNRNAYYVNPEKRYYQGMDYVNYGINMYHYTRMASRDLFPRLGFSAFAKLQTTPFEDKIFSEIYAVSSRFYLPGLFRNHSFQVRYAYQYQSPLRYYYSTLIGFPSGYLIPGRTEELHLLSLNYAMPLFYPDLHAGPLFYLKRFRSNFFFDIAQNNYHLPGQSNIITSDILRSVGTDLVADIHFLRIMFPFQAGIRIGFLPTAGEFFTQAIFSVNLVY